MLDKFDKVIVRYENLLKDGTHTLAERELYKNILKDLKYLKKEYINENKNIVGGFIYM